jgi:hypothetical protein
MPDSVRLFRPEPCGDDIMCCLGNGSAEEDGIGSVLVIEIRARGGRMTVMTVRVGLGRCRRVAASVKQRLEGAEPPHELEGMRALTALSELTAWGMTRDWMFRSSELDMKFTFEALQLTLPCQAPGARTQLRQPASSLHNQ